MIFDIIGWVGMIMVLLAYGLLSLKIIKAGFIYQIMNLVAALLMAIGLFPKDAWFSFVLQVAWGIIAIASIVVMIVGKPKNKAKRVK